MTVNRPRSLNTSGARQPGYAQYKAVPKQQLDRLQRVPVRHAEHRIGVGQPASISVSSPDVSSRHSTRSLTKVAAAALIEIHRLQTVSKPPLPEAKEPRCWRFGLLARHDQPPRWAAVSVRSGHAAGRHGLSRRRRPAAGTASVGVPSRRRVSLAWLVYRGLGRLGHPQRPVLAALPSQT